MRKKYYFVVRAVEGDVFTLVSKDRDSKKAEEKLLASFKGIIKEILSITEYEPSKNNIEKLKAEVREAAEKKAAEKEATERETLEKENNSPYKIDRITGIVNVF